MGFSLFYLAWGSWKFLDVGVDNSSQFQKILAIISSYASFAPFSLSSRSGTLNALC